MHKLKRISPENAPHVLWECRICGDIGTIPQHWATECLNLEEENMGHRNEDGTLEDSCLDNIKPGEPFFVLRGQDRLAPALVRAWATLALEHGMEKEKVNEAVDCAFNMEEWGNRKFPD